MTETINIIIPVFGIILLGYGLARLALFGGDLYQRLTDFVFWVPVPALLFQTLTEADFNHAAPGQIWLVYFGALAIVWITAHAVSRHLFRLEPARSAVAGLSATFSNMILVGLPVVLSTFGQAGLAPLLIIVSIHTPIMLAVSTVLIEFASTTGGRRDWRAMAGRLARNLVKNPIVLSLIAGALWRFGGLSMPGPLAGLIDSLAQTAAPTALFALGLSLYNFGLGAHFGTAICLVLLKIAAFPLLVYVGVQTFIHLPPLWEATIVLCAACPSGVNAYLMASHFRTGERLAAQTITLTTFLSMFTLAIWILVLRDFAATTP